jgi:hypothetical protein
MRAKLLFLAAVMMVGCSDDEATPAVVGDAAPETIGIDVADSSPRDTAVDSTVADSAIDSGTEDTAKPDTADSATTETALDTAVIETALDTAMDTTLADTTEAAVDSADTALLDALDTSVTDAMFAVAPTCDGTIGTAEYGVHVEGKNQYTHTGTSTTWYVTWDDTALYVAIANANVAEGAVVYIDANPVAPPIGGTAADGNLAGHTYDSTNFAMLPFRANLVAYAKSTYLELRTATGTGTWSTPTSPFGCFDGSGSTREFRIPWSAIGGRPASFGFLGYVTSGAGFVYGEVPMANPEGTIGASATATKYFHVGATGPTSTTNAFADER